MFKAAEINRWTAEAVEMENGKKSWVEYHLRCKATLPILECLVNELKKKQCRAANKQGAGDATLVEGCPCVKNGERCEQTHPVPTISRGRCKRGEYSCPVGREIDQIELYALRNALIKMANTSYGCFLVQHTRDVDRAYQKMSAKEKVDIKQKMAKIYKVGADNGQSLPPSLTPIQLISLTSKLHHSNFSINPTYLN